MFKEKAKPRPASSKGSFKAERASGQQNRKGYAP
jgi:hypothetical protein